MFSIRSSCSLLALGTAHAGSTAQHGTHRCPGKTLPGLLPRHLQEPFPTSQHWKRSRCWGTPPSIPWPFPGSCFLLLPRVGVHADPPPWHSPAQPLLNPVARLCRPMRSWHRAGGKQEQNPAPRSPGSQTTQRKSLAKPPAPPPTRWELLATAGARCQTRFARPDLLRLHPYPGTAPCGFPWKGSGAGTQPKPHLELVRPLPGWDAEPLPTTHPTTTSAPHSGEAAFPQPRLRAEGARWVPAPASPSAPPQPSQLSTWHKHPPF